MERFCTDNQVYSIQLLDDSVHPWDSRLRAFRQTVGRQFVVPVLPRGYAYPHRSRLKPVAAWEMVSNIHINNMLASFTDDNCADLWQPHPKGIPYGLKL
jgi:hypothetical protein